MRFTISICVLVLMLPAFSGESACPAGAERTPGETIKPLKSKQTMDFPVDVVVAAMTGITDEELIENVRTGVSDGGDYVASGNRTWHEAHRCLGCHTQTQSHLGLATSQDRADIDIADTRFAYNVLASAVQNDGRILDSHPEVPESQTTVAVWSLIEWPNRRESLRAVIRGLEYLYDARTVDSVQDHVYWDTDHASGWWVFREGNTAAVVKAACRAIQAHDDLGSITDYDTGTSISLSTSSTPVSIASTGGMLFVLYQDGTIDRVNPLTSERTEWADLTLSGPRSLAAADDGTLYASGGNSIVVINADQTTETHTVSGFPTPLIISLEVDDEGTLYMADFNNSRILTMDESGSTTQLASGNGISNPIGISLGPGGDVIVSNASGNRYRLLSVDDQGDVTTHSDGFAMVTGSLAGNGAGNTFVITGSSSHLATATGVNLVRGSGTIERIFAHPTNGSWLDVTVLNGTAWMLDQAGSVTPIVEEDMDTGALDDLEDALPDIAEYFMDYDSTETENLTLAFRLIGLAEIRNCVTDTTLLAGIDDAMDDLETLLRNRQQDNGGWARLEPPGNNCEDPLITAWVGTALNTTNPESDDTMVVDTVNFLLEEQDTNGSWGLSGCGDLFSTRLASTSLVMAYMPRALEVLDTDLDDDGLENDVDNCPGVANGDQADNDGDGLGDACDPDDDDDTIIDELDNCPTTANTDQADTDGDGFPNACGDDDDDDDGVLDVDDNCPTTPNPDQADQDGDGIGDACDGDNDNDGIQDGVDNCPFTANADQADEDMDGIGDVCDRPDVPETHAAVVATTQDVMIHGGAIVDGFDSCAGPYGGANISSGDVYAGTGIQVLSNAVTGAVHPNTPSDGVAFELPDDITSSGDLFLNGSMTLPAGDYLFNNITVNGNATLTGADGLVRIWFSGRLELRSNALVNSTGNHAFNLWFFSTEGADSVHLQSNSVVHGAVYAPNVPVTVYSNAHVYGTVYGSRVELQANANVHWNQSLPDRECVTPDSVLPSVPNALESTDGDIRLQPDAYVDSYDSCIGAYGGSNIGNQAAVQSSRALHLEGSAHVYGSTSSNTASAATATLAPAGLAATGDLNINGTTTLAPGDYLFHNINIQSNGHLLTDPGLVRIFFTGNINIQGNGSAQAGHAGDLWFFDQGQNGNVTLGSNALVRGVMHTPNLMITIQSNAVLDGAATGKSFMIQTNAAIHYDTALANGCGNN